MWAWIRVNCIWERVFISVSKWKSLPHVVGGCGIIAGSMLMPIPANPVPYNSPKYSEPKLTKDDYVPPPASAFLPGFLPGYGSGYYSPGNGFYNQPQSLNGYANSIPGYSSTIQNVTTNIDKTIIPDIPKIIEPSGISMFFTMLLIFIGIKKYANL